MSSPEDLLDFSSHLLTKDKFRPKPSPLPKKLYHYCGSAGLMGVIQNKEIWATESNFLNDKTELFHGIDIISEVCSHQLQSNPPANIGALLTEIQKHPIIEKKSHSHIASHIFTTSFSEVEDDLNQWRCYSENGAGFCIGIDPSEMFQSVFYKLEYDRNNQLQIIDSCLNSIFQDLSSMMPNLMYSLGSGQAVPQPLTDIIVGTLLINSLTLKHPVFRAEQEWRTILIVRKDHQGAMFPLFTTNFEGRVVPRAKIPFIDPAKSKAGIDIWMGPRRNFDTTKIALEFELTRLKLPKTNVRLYPSKVPYQ